MASVSKNSSFKALRQAVEQLERGSSCSPRQHSANRKALGLLFFGVFGTLSGGVLVELALPGLLPLWVWLALLVFDGYAAWAGRKQWLVQSTLPQTWEQRLRQVLEELSLVFDGQPAGQQLQAWSCAKELPLQELKQWLASQR